VTRGREGGPYLKVGIIHPSKVGNDVPLLPVLVLERGAGREEGREGRRIDVKACVDTVHEGRRKGGREGGRTYLQGWSLEAPLDEEVSV